MGLLHRVHVCTMNHFSDFRFNQELAVGTARSLPLRRFDAL